MGVLLLLLYVLKKKKKKQSSDKVLVNDEAMRAKERENPGADRPEPRKSGDTGLRDGAGRVQFGSFYPELVLSLF